ncbi:MAG: hypothetical protein JEZ06_08840 [Anaerolineaceae bacterium]|nr:hypothetical protein [Anaerolineaceae bacterium]
MTTQTRSKIIKGKKGYIKVSRTHGKDEKMTFSHDNTLNFEPEIIDEIRIEVFMNDELIADTDQIPEALNRFMPRDGRLIAQERYARIGRVLITREDYNSVIKALDELDLEFRQVGN